LNRIRSVALALALVSAPVSLRAESCKLTEVGSLPITFDSNGGLVVPVDLGDGVPRPFLVDLSSPRTFLRDRTLAAAHLEKLGTLAGTVFQFKEKYLQHRTIIPILKLDGAAITDVKAWVLPAEADSFDTSNDAGILGVDVLGSYDVELDFVAGQLNLFSPDHCPGHVVYWSAKYAKSQMDYANGFFDVQLTLDGKSVPFVVHTTGDGSFISATLATEVFSLTSKSDGLVAGDTNNVSWLDHLYNYPFKNLYWGEISFGDPDLRIVDPKANEYDWWRVTHVLDRGVTGEMAAPPTIMMYNGLQPLIMRNIATASLGLTYLKQLRLYFAFQEREVYFTPSK
jgi:hypothetical protein